MILADLEVFHNRSYSPTRRIALGRCHLPVDPPPGFGPLLLGGVVAVGAEDLAADDVDGLQLLMRQCEHGHRVVQPRMRHRFQTDHHGLARTVGRLVGGGETVELDFDGHGSPLQMTLASIYAAAALPLGVRPRVYEVLRRALRWRGPVDRRLFTHLSGPAGTAAWTAAAFGDPTEWALVRLGLTRNGKLPGAKEIQRRFRLLLREAHPDHGGETVGAAERIAELSEARRILLGS
jgi:hypothetical protein